LTLAEIWVNFLPYYKLVDRIDECRNSIDDRREQDVSAIIEKNACKNLDFRSMARVSVIIPVYNGDRYIVKAIESVLKQNYRDFEIVIIDDGSIDNSFELLQPYLESNRARIRYQKQENQGVAAARNLGLKIARGSYIAFLDQDDYFFPDKLEAQVNYLENNPTIGMVHSGWQRVDADGNLLGTVEPWQNSPQLDLRNWLLWKPVLLGAMMFRRQWLNDVGGLDTQFKQVCDLDLVWRLSLAGCQTGWLRQLTLYYREHDSNDSLNTIVQAQESEAILDKFYSLPQIPTEIKALEKEYRYYTLVWIAWRFYYTDRLPEMFVYLEKSLQNSHMLPVETILHWVESFGSYASGVQKKVNFYQLSQLPEWQASIDKYVLKVTR
jgi:glycosyltransferase involved in cell wall biosynthesis